MLFSAFWQRLWLKKHSFLPSSSADSLAILLFPPAAQYFLMASSLSLQKIILFSLRKPQRSKKTLEI